MNPMIGSNDFQFFWYEGPLSWVAEFCLRSFTRFPGVTIHLYTYDRNLDVTCIPQCICHDASDFLPRDVVDRWLTGTGGRGLPAISTLFRYKLLYEKGGWYFDTDCILLKPLTPFYNSDYVFAWENAWDSQTRASRMICNAVLKFPKGDQMLHHLYHYCVQLDPKTWQPGGLVPIFTEHVRRFGLINRALSPESFYPIASNSQFQQQSTLEDRTYIIHLFQQVVSIRECNLNNQIKILTERVEALNNSMSLRIGRKLSFGRHLRRH